MGPTKVFWGPMKPTFKFGNVYPPLELAGKGSNDILRVVGGAPHSLILAVHLLLLLYSLHPFFPSTIFDASYSVSAIQ